MEVLLQTLSIFLVFLIYAIGAYHVFEMRALVSRDFDELSIGCGAGIIHGLAVLFFTLGVAELYFKINIGWFNNNIIWFGVIFSNISFFVATFVLPLILMLRGKK